MGKKLDALFGRKFKTSKFSTLAKLAVSRIAILKNQRQVRFSHAKSDVIQLLNLGHQERALLRVEHVFNDQNMVDAFVMMEDYLHFLKDRVVQLERNKECPDELKEAISSLIFASSRCGEFPELQEIRGIFVSRFGNEIAARAVELRGNCGVNPKIIQKLSVKQPSLESKKKLLKDIASENGIILHLEADAPEVAQVKSDVNKPKQQEQHAEDSKSAKLHVTESQAKTHALPEKELSQSLKGRKKYKDVAAAALEAFESAAYAAQAARAAVELSRYDSQDNERDDHGDSSHGQGTLYDSDGSLTPELQSKYKASEENQQSNDWLVFNEIHKNDNVSSESEDENMKENGRVHLKEFEKIKTKPGFDRTPSNSSSDSNGSMWNEREQLSDSLSHNKPVGKEMVSYLAEKKAERGQVSIPSPKHHDLDSYRNTNLLADENQHIRQYNAVHEEYVSDEDETKLPYQSPKWIPLKSHADTTLNPTKGNYEYKTAHSTNSAEKLSSRANIDRKHISVRTRRAKGA